MNRYLHRRIASLVAAALLCSLPPLSLRAQDDRQPTIRFVRNPEPAPGISLTGLDGQPFTLAATKGKVVLVNFWATWCGPCRAEIPDLIALRDKYKDRLQILALDVDDDDAAAVQKFVAKSHINYPVAISSDEVRAEYGGIAALPTSFLLDAEGRIVQKHEGLRDPVLYEVEIRSLLGMDIGNIKVESFEDTGQIFLKNASKASELPGVDMSKLTPEQKTAALHKFNAENCTCPCGYTLAQCRVLDRDCPISKAATSKIIAALLHPKAAPGKGSQEKVSPEKAPEKTGPGKTVPPAAKPDPRQ